MLFLLKRLVGLVFVFEYQILPVQKGSIKTCTV